MMIRRLSALLALTTFCAFSVAQERPTYELITNVADQLDGVGNGNSDSPAFTPDGAFVAFRSSASNFVEGDNNGASDIFVVDRVTGEIDLISSDDNDDQLRFDSARPDISNDGRFVVFENNGTAWLKDRVSRQLAPVSQTPAGAPAAGFGPKISGNGEVIAFLTQDSSILGEFGFEQVVAFDRVSGSVEVLSLTPDGALSNGSSQNITISDDGQRVVFQSFADNLVLDVNNRDDVFLADRAAAAMILVSSNEGIQGNQDSFGASISADGSAVAFISGSVSWFGDLGAQQVFLRQLDSTALRLMSIDASGNTADFIDGLATMSDDGSSVAFTASGIGSEPNRFSSRCHIRMVTSSDLQSLHTPTCSILGGGEAIYFVSGNAFVTRDVNDRRDVYLQGLEGTSDPDLVSAASPGSRILASATGSLTDYQISGDGLSVGFSYQGFEFDQFGFRSFAYVVDRGLDGVMQLVDPQGEPPNDDVYVDDVSADGRFVLATTRAQNLVPNADFRSRLVLLDRETGQFEEIADRLFFEFEGKNGSISANGRFVAFSSSNDSLISPDVNNSADVFVLDRDTGIVELVSVSSNGVQSNANSLRPKISDNGRFIAFSGISQTLLPGLSGNIENIFLFDRQTDTLELASGAFDGGEANGFSTVGGVSDQGHVVFTSDAGNLTDDQIFNRLAYLFRLSDGSVELISANGIRRADFCESVDISSDGLWAVFECSGESLDENRGFDTQFQFGFTSVYRRSLTDGRVEFVAINDEGFGVESFTPRLSANGQVVAFQASVPGLVGGSNGNQQLYVADFGEPILELPIFADGFE